MDDIYECVPILKKSYAEETPGKFTAAIQKGSSQSFQTANLIHVWCMLSCVLGSGSLYFNILYMDNLAYTASDLKHCLLLTSKQRGGMRYPA